MYEPAALKKLAVFIGLLLLMMCIGLLYGIANGNFAAEISRITAMPWGLVTFLDIYIGFFLLGVWILWREVHPLKAALFFIPILLLGNLFSCVYILYAIYSSAGDVQKFIHGRRI